jgi:hypothetical protein
MDLHMKLVSVLAEFPLMTGLVVWETDYRQEASTLSPVPMAPFVRSTSLMTMLTFLPANPIASTTQGRA